MSKKLKIGILLDKDNIPAWSYKMLEEIQESDYAEIVLIVQNNLKSKKKQNLAKRIWGNRKEIMMTLYKKYDNHQYKNDPEAFELKNINTFLNVDRLKVTPKQTKFSDTIIDNDIKKIDKYNIDVFIRMGFRILRGDILTISKYGIWSYHHGDNSVNRGGPAGFWEVMENHDVTGVILQILNEDLDNGTILFKSYSNTYNKSVLRNKNNYYWKALSFLPSKLEELYNLGDEKFFHNIKKLNTHPEFYYNPLYSSSNISNLKMSIFMMKKIISRLKNKLISLFYFNQWILLFKLNKSNTLSTSFYRFKKILPPKDRFWADPHVIFRNNKYYIFIEELIYKNIRGHISVIIMDEKGNYSNPIKVLEENYHLSYPFLIEENNTLYMIPESKENNTIDLYKCIDFPTKWKLEKTLINNIKAVDATIIKKEGVYWMYANVVRNNGASSLDELFLFSSKTLISDNWTPHPKNPIISDVKQARPAGSLFIFNDNLYRPSQNSGKHYGHGIKINKVIELNQTNYIEQTVNSIYPNWENNLNSTHTINSVNKLTIIDANIKRRK